MQVYVSEVRWWIAWKLCSLRIKSGFKGQLPKPLSSGFRCFRLLNHPERPHRRDVHSSQASYSERQNTELLVSQDSVLVIVIGLCHAYYRSQGEVMFSQVSVCPQSASWLLSHCSSLLQHGRYASYWNAFLFQFFSFLFYSHIPTFANVPLSVSQCSVYYWQLYFV